MKISNWESIPYSMGLQCPNSDDGSLMENKSKVIGWCDTPRGLMKVCESAKYASRSSVIMACMVIWKLS